MILEKPHYCPDGQSDSVTIEFLDDHYPATVKARLVYVGSMKHSPKSDNALLRRKKDARWTYAFQFEDYCGCYDQLLGLLYDRVTTMPGQIRLDSGVFEDLSINLKQRTIPPYSEKRSYARIEKNEIVPCPEAPEGTVKIHDINYVCVTLTGTDLPQVLTLQIAGLDLKCLLNRYNTDGYILYMITNIDELMRSAENEQALSQWMASTAAEKRSLGKKQKTGEFDEIEELLTK